MTSVCQPLLHLPAQKGFAVDTEPITEALGVLVWFAAHAARPGKVARPPMFARTPHTAEWKGGKEGLTWSNKACESAMIATAIMNPELENWQDETMVRIQRRGAVGHDQSYLMQGVVVLVKDWGMGRCRHRRVVARYSYCGECDRPVWEGKRSAITEDEAGEETGHLVAGMGPGREATGGEVHGRRGHDLRDA